jgi:hypothetical protein
MLKTLTAIIFFCTLVLGLDITNKASVMSMKKRSKSRRATRRIPGPFIYKSRRKQISGKDDNKHLLLLCYIDSLRWLIWPLLILLVAWLRSLLSG